MKEFLRKKCLIVCVVFLLIAAAVVLFLCYTIQDKKESNFVERNEDECYKIGFITDIHGRRPDKDSNEVGEEVRNTLSYFVEHMNNKFHPDLIVDGGDLIEGSFREGQKSIDDFNVLKKYFEKINVPTYHLIGNHEMRGLSKEEWLNLAGTEKSFYNVNYKDLQIIVLDGNENNKFKTENYNKDYYYISDEQFRWLEEVLSEKNELKKIVFIHYPLVEMSGGKMIEPGQSARLRDIFSRNNILSVFSGHTEELNFQEINGVKYYIIPGLNRSKEKEEIWFDSFAEIRIGESTEVTLFYKKNRNDNYQTLKIPSEEFNQIEK